MGVSLLLCDLQSSEHAQLSIVLLSHIKNSRTVTDEFLRIHMNKHNRPFKCGVAGCPHSSGFSAKGDLERHKRAKHKDLFLNELGIQPSNQFCYCSEPSCRRSSSSSNRNPFTRTDNLQEHIKRRHKDLLPKNPVGIQESSGPAAITQALSMPEDSVGHMHAVMPGTRKRRRLDRSTLVSENADGVNEELDRL